MEQENQSSELNQKDDPTKYAGFWIRFVAFNIDGILVRINLYILGIIAGYIISSLSSSSLQYVVYILYILIFIILSLGYYIYLTYTSGATFGKRIMGIKVISNNQNILSLKQVILRETIGKIVSAIFFIGYIMVGFDKKKQGFHDQIAKTLVIYNDPNNKIGILRTILIWIIPVIVFGYIIIGTLYEVFLKSSGTLN